MRIVCLTGLGGSGKTRLALEAATELQEGFEHAFFVDLAPVHDAQLVGSAIAEVLGVQEAPDRPLQQALVERLADVPTLLFLNNFGQVLPAAQLVAELVAAAPGLKVLVTSRTPLRVPGEREYAVPPLAVPPPGAAAADSPAVQLFVARAQEAKPSFELTDDNLAAVAEICRRLEGIPLAIELAAARVKLLTPAQILDRLAEKRLSFLTGGSETMRDAIEWSYNLLDERSKSLFARLAVFAGGSSLEAAEAVAGQPLGLEFGEVLDGLAALVDNGLVRQGEAVDGEPRFGMLETIREYALERLAERGELEDAHSRHLNRYVVLAETAEPELTRSGQALWLERLTEENDNIRAALAWSFESHQVELGLRLAGALVRFWSVRGLMTEGRRWLTEALAESTGVQPSVLGKAYFAAGFAALGQGDFPLAKPFFEESLRLGEQGEDKRLQAQAYQQIGWLLSASGKDEEGSVERAKEYAGKALGLAREIGDKLVESGALNILAELAASEGDETAANALYEQSLALRRELGDKRLIANSVLTLGRAELTRGDNRKATSLLLEGCTLARELGDTWSVSVALINLARVALRNGDLPEAGKLFGEALALAKERGDKRAAAECLQGLGAFAAGDGDPAQGARLLGAAAALLDSIGAAPSAIEAAIGKEAAAMLLTALGEDQLATETAAGRAWAPNDAIERALSIAPSPNALVAATA